MFYTEHSERCNAFRYMAFQVGLRGYLKKCLIIHSLNPLQLCPNHELGRFFKSFQTELLKKVFPETSLTL